MTKLEQEVKMIMSQVFEMDEAEITADTSQKNCDRWDSLHHLTLASELEDEYGIELEPEEIAEMTDFRKVVAMVESMI